MIRWRKCLRSYGGLRRAERLVLLGQEIKVDLGDGYTVEVLGDGIGDARVWGEVYRWDTSDNKESVPIRRNRLCGVVRGRMLEARSLSSVMIDAVHVVDDDKWLRREKLIP